MFNILQFARSQGSKGAGRRAAGVRDSQCSSLLAAVTQQHQDEDALNFALVGQAPSAFRTHCPNFRTNLPY